MNQIPGSWTIIEQDQLISEALERDQPRLRNFIRKHVTDTSEAEDILQDVFYELLEAYRLMKPIEHVTAWLFRVARNRMVDLFRRKKPSSLNNPASPEADGATLEDLLPSADYGPRRPMRVACSSTHWMMPLKSYPKRNEKSSLPTS